MSKRARLGGRSESWMVDDDVAARWFIRAVTGDPGRAAAALQLIRPVLDDARPAAAGPAAGEERSDR